MYSVKLKLEFIVLNQLLTLVKKGLAPTNPQLVLAPDSPDSSQFQLPSPSAVPIDKSGHMLGQQPQALTSQQKRGWLASSALKSILHPRTVPTTTPVAVTIGGDVLPTSVREKELDDPHVFTQRSDSSDSDQTLTPVSNEQDLKALVGKPDDLTDKDIEDIERQYLGRWK